MLKLFIAALLTLALGTGVNAASELVLHEEGRWTVQLSKEDDGELSCMASVTAMERNNDDNFWLLILAYNKDLVLSGNIVGEAVPTLLQGKIVSLRPLRYDDPNKFETVITKVMTNGPIVGWIVNDELRKTFLKPLSSSDALVVRINDTEAGNIWFSLDGFNSSLIALNDCAEMLK